jgi:bacterioferritin (cytochrome b1)
VAVTKDMLLSELQDLLRLTAFEQTIANVRRLQARATPIAQELAANAVKSGERKALLSDAVRQVGGVPDVVGAGMAKAGAFLQTQVNQVQTLQGALLGDLALEHSLRERARYARTMADKLGYDQVVPVLDRLETAHTATIEWLEARLSEVAETGTSALKATPAQSAVMTVRRVAGMPFGVVAGTVNRATALLARKTSSVQDVAADVASRATETAAPALDKAVDTAKQVAGQAAETAQSVAGQASETAQSVAGQASETAQSVAGQATETAQSAAGAIADAAPSSPDVIDLTGVDSDHMPFAAYDKLSGDSVMRHAKDTEDVEELRAILAFEQAHKSRKGVVQAVTERLEELANA